MSVEWKDGTIVNEAYVTIDDVKHEVTPAEYEGDTPVSAHNLNKMQSDLQSSIDNATVTKYTIELTEDITQNTDYTLPCTYTVGNNSLEIYIAGVLMIKDENYIEVGEEGELSNTIQFLDWDVSSEYSIIVMISGVTGSGQGNDLIAKVNNREHKHTYYTYEVTEDIDSGTEITLPCDYVVSSNNLVLYDFFGKRLIKDTHYTEVGEEGEVSSTVILLFDIKYSEEYDKVFDIVIKEVDND